MIKARQAIKIEEAFNKLLESKKDLGEIHIHVDNSLNYVISRDIYAPLSIPSFRRSMYDGYAIRKEDDEGFPKSIKVVGELPCGEVFSGNLERNQAVRIMTGAKVPDDAGKVIMLEYTEPSKEQDEVVILRTHATDNINPIGSDFFTGDTILEKGDEVNAGTISLLRAFGIETVPVFRKPKVAVLSTGTELLSLGEPIQDGKIYDSNRPLLEQLVREHNGELIYSGQLPDQKGSIEKTLSSLAQEADIIVTTGGVSVGDFDFMAEVVEGHQLLFNKIQMRPGSPTSAAWAGDTLLMALSGNPGACFIGFHLFIKPYIRHLMQCQQVERRATAVLQTDYLKENAFDRILRAQHSFNESGQLCVTPVGSDQSSSLGNLHQTTCFVKIPGGEEGKRQGDYVDVWML
ncbi:molybdopterin molybdotransferase MoeA [Bacillus thermotolerans]|uniref:molybdopterin molybdotransferase MoeA n=1 Tax=Bacillus thermotolerans TaxID=1221996 RepID=UPI00057C8053|nr:molybdopterin molybdotransferase MoeA [Bacillus thermotolerans]KKB36902.1 Molybdopterin biosynthesis protein MoeA [Bacillus thermotolerans]